MLNDARARCPGTRSLPVKGVNTPLSMPAQLQPGKAQGPTPAPGALSDNRCQGDPLDIDQEDVPISKAVQTPCNASARLQGAV